MSVANSCCDGRVVSVLEGGYNVAGQFVSPFAKVASSPLIGDTRECTHTYIHTYTYTHIHIHTHTHTHTLKRRRQRPVDW